MITYEDFCKSIIYMEALKHFRILKEIKMTQDYVDEIMAKVPKIELHKFELHNCPSGYISTFEGIPIVVDDTLDKPYKLVFVGDDNYE